MSSISARASAVTAVSRPMSAARPGPGLSRYQYTESRSAVMHSAEMVSDMISPSLIQKFAYSAVRPAAISPARRPTTRMASRPTAPTTAAPSTAMSSRCCMIGS